MKGVDTIARIRREFFSRGRTIKEIVRELHVSRNTVRKVLRSGATEFSCERTVQPLPRIGQWKTDPDRILSGNEAKPARERLTVCYRAIVGHRTSLRASAKKFTPPKLPDLSARIISPVLPPTVRKTGTPGAIS